MTDKSKGQKLDPGKPQLSLLPYAPLCAVAEVLAFGCAKYSRDNWQHVPDGRQCYLDALLRHAHAYADGETHDPESGLHHLAHAACKALFVIWFDIQQAHDVNNDVGAPEWFVKFKRDIQKIQEAHDANNKR